MSQRRHTFQYKEVISINREYFLDVLVSNENLSRKDLRVILFLTTKLDSKKYTKVSLKNIANFLNLSKKDVEKSIDHLIEEDIIRQGSDDYVDCGYKLLF